jgi:hypothetical protein
MSLGWGLRGYIGGGPLGAMIPGAMVALALCLLLNRKREANGIAAAFGAVGVGFGGQMTYGQTIGLTMQPETAAWGLLGLTLKGAIWGLLGGAIIGTGLQRELPPRRLRLAALCLMAACTIGWKFVNEPKLIYFSDPINKPRPEIWAGLLLAALAFLFVTRSRIVWEFAGIACVGGGAGFGIGGWINALGRTGHIHTPIDWWKVMEFTFGFLFGAALGYAAWRNREALSQEPAVESSKLWWLLIPLVPICIAAEERSSFRFAYTVVGALLLPLVAANVRFAWQIAITMTCTAFAWDFAESRAMWSLRWIFVAVVSLATCWFTDRKRDCVFAMFLFLTWVAVFDSHLKSWAPPFEWSSKAYAHAHVEIAFTVMAAIVTWLAVRVRRV